MKALILGFAMKKPWEIDMYTDGKPYVKPLEMDRLGAKAEQILGRSYHEKDSVCALIRLKVCQEIVHLRITMGGDLTQC